jgi:hypothetical protein
MEYLINQDHNVETLFHSSNISEFPQKGKRNYPKESHVFASSNRGAIHYLYDNPYHRQYLEETLALSQESAFRCAYHFLFTENEAVQKAMGSHYDVLSESSKFSTFVKQHHQHHNHNASALSGSTASLEFEPKPIQDHNHTMIRSLENKEQESQRRKLMTKEINNNDTLPEVSSNQTQFLMKPMIKIGIGIRVGDQSFDPLRDLKTQLGPFEHYLFCANTIEKTLPLEFKSFIAKDEAIAEPSIHATWYVMAESLKIRQLIHQKYGYKVLVNAETSYFHGDCTSKKYGGCHQKKLDDSIIHAVAQLKLFAMCDIHIISESGFPRVASMLAKPPHRFYLLNKDQGTSFNKTCTYANYVAYEKIQKLGCGIR